MAAYPSRSVYYILANGSEKRNDRVTDSVGLVSSTTGGFVEELNDADMQ